MHQQTAQDEDSTLCSSLGLRRQDQENGQKICPLLLRLLCWHFDAAVQSSTLLFCFFLACCTAILIGGWSLQSPHVAKIVMMQVSTGECCIKEESQCRKERTGHHNMSARALTIGIWVVLDAAIPEHLELKCFIQFLELVNVVVDCRKTVRTD